MKETSKQEILEAVERVSKNSYAWHGLPYSEKLELLKDVRDRLQECYFEWGNACNNSRGHPLESVHRGHGFVIGPGLCGIILNQWIETYESLALTGVPPPPCSTRVLPDGSCAVKVFPYKAADAMITDDTHIELHLNGPLTQDLLANSKPGVAGILGAGNYEAPSEILTQLFGLGHVAVYKTHPNLVDSTGPYLKILFRSLIHRGFVAIVEGGVDAANVLISSPAISELAMTGGCKTFDAIVWGTGSPEEVARRKTSGHRRVTKPFCAELGAASPYIIVPGQWTPEELAHQVDYLVLLKMNNASCVCASPQVVLVDDQWAHLDQFVALLTKRLADYPRIPVFYPGSAERTQALVDGTLAHSPDARVLWPLGDEPRDRTPSGQRDLCRPAVIIGANADSPAVKTEAFAPLLVIVPVKSKTGLPSEFLETAVSVCNEKVFGSLSCTLIVDPRTMMEERETIEQAVVNLNWGTVGVNEWGATASIFGCARWGAPPGRHSDLDVQSGIGEINNCRLYDNVKKTVLWNKFVTPAHGAWPTESGKGSLPLLVRYAVWPESCRALL